MTQFDESEDAERIATFTHDAGGTQTLFAYRPEPAEVTRAGELMANRLYGIIDTRSPKTPYICCWRDTDPHRFRAPPDAGPPHKILMACSFGTSAWLPPADLMENATQAMQREAPKEPTITFMMAGSAPPIPDWVLY
jgi:hypothetical protein